MWVQATLEQCEAVVDLFTEAHRIVVPKPKPEVEDDDATTKGRVKYLAGCFRVYYTDDKGAKHNTNKGLSVPKTNVEGKPLAHQVFEKHLQEYRHKARQLWNKLDKSGKGRFPETAAD